MLSCSKGKDSRGGGKKQTSGWHSGCSIGCRVQSYSLFACSACHQDKLNRTIWIAHFTSDCYHTFQSSFLSRFFDHWLVRMTTSYNKD